MAKRKIARADSNQPSKIFKLVPAAAPCLPQFPQEVSDIILSYTVDIPNRPYHGDPWENSTSKLFTNPLFLVSRRMRQAVLDTISQKCIWIEVKAHERRYRRLLEDLASYVHELPESRANLLSPNRPTLTLGLGREVTRPQNTRDFVKARTRLIFPYNFHSLMQLIAKLRPCFKDRFTQRRPLEYLCVRWTGATGHHQNIFHEEILPVLQMLRYIPKIECIDCCIYTKEQLVAMTTNLCDFQTFHQDVTQTWNTITQFEADGLLEEAKCISFYMSDKLGQDGSFAQRSPETLVFFLGRTGWQDDPTLQMRISTIRAAFNIHYHAFEAYTSFINRDWRWHKVPIPSYNPMVYLWQHQPYYPWFGLPTTDLAKVNFMTATTRMRHALFMAKYHEFENSRGCTKQFLCVGITNLFESAIRTAAGAVDLDPQCAKYREFYDNLLDLARTRGVDVSATSNLTSIKHHYIDVDGEARTVIGEPWCLRDWTSLEHELSYMHRAQMLAMRG